MWCFLHASLADTELGRSGKRILMDHPCPVVLHLFPPTLVPQRADYCFALGSSHHQFNKSDQQNHFHPWLSYFWTLHSALEVWVVRTLFFFSLSFLVFFFFFCSGNTWWSFNVRIESPSGTVKTSACVMMNGCLVCWFYGVFSGSLHCGRQPPWVGCQLKERGGGGNGGDVQLPVVILCASHPVHLRTWGSHKEPLARRTQSF